MEATFPLLFAVVLGFTHAFEADHLLAVSNMVTRRNRVWQAAKDGIFWGLGHSSTILLIGLIMLVGKHQIADQTFGYFEAGVGLMLVALGLWRLRKLRAEHDGPDFDESDRHSAAYGVGAIHGLAGSGALMVLVISQLTTVYSALAYLLLFGLGSVAGMLLAAGIFCLPFSKTWMTNRSIQIGLIVLSSALCVAFGGKLLYENLLI
jgi:hypothetical protein